MSEAPSSICTLFVISADEDPQLTQLRRERLEALGVAIIESPLSGKGASELPASEWVLINMPGDVVLPDLLDSAAVALDGYDAVYGGVMRRDAGSGELVHMDEARYGCSELPKVIFRNPETWFATSFFVRGSLLGKLGLESIVSTEGRLALWADERATKLGRPFVISEGAVDRSAVWGDILAYFRTHQILKQVNFDSEDFTFRIAYWNPYMESHWAAGRLFEDEQLLGMKRAVPEGAVIVDVGANIGQHTLFFAKNMKAKKVLPIEPDPALTGIIREHVTLNGAGNVDCSLLGVGVSDAPGTCRMSGSTNDPQNMVLDYDSDGDIPLHPLDELITEPVEFVKIDVDDAEMTVLAGMTRILREDRPALAVEVIHPNLPAFMDLMRANGYHIDHVFSNPQYSDILAVPV